jgi:hypothetical protein
VTTPKIPTRYQNGARVYIHPTSGAEAVGVTSVLQMEPKPFLTRWAAKLTAEEAVENFATLEAFMAAGNSAAAIDWLKKASDRARDEAAAFGDQGHSVMEAEALRASGIDAEADPETVIAFAPSRFQDGLRSVLAHFREFLAEFEVEFLSMEETVWSETHGYAGSFDALVEITDPGSGERVPLWLDYKTSKSVYSSTGKQLAAYKNADFVVYEDGSRDPIPADLREAGGAVLWNRAEGWRLHPVQTDEEVFEQFLRDLQTLRYEKNTARGVVGHPVNKGAQKKRRARKAERVSPWLSWRRLAGLLDRHGPSSRQGEAARGEPRREG